MTTTTHSQPPTARRSWASVVRNKSITLYEEVGYEEARRARQAEAILTRALNANAVIFDFGTNLPSKAEAYRTIKQLGPITGARTISRSRNPRSLLIEARDVDDKHRDQAIKEGVVYDNVNYRATRAITVDADITKVNFSQLPFMEPEAIREALEATMSQYGRVCQIRLYVEPETETFEGEATVILDRSTPADAMLSDNAHYYRPLTRFIHIDAWDELFPASWRNAPPVCRYCRAEGHRKDACPQLKDVKCYHCQLTGHIRRNCPVARKERLTRHMDSLTDTELLDQYPSSQQPTPTQPQQSVPSNTHQTDDSTSNNNSEQHASQQPLDQPLNDTAINDNDNDNERQITAQLIDDDDSTHFHADTIMADRDNDSSSDTDNHTPSKKPRTQPSDRNTRSMSRHQSQLTDKGSASPDKQ